MSKAIPCFLAPDNLAYAQAPPRVGAVIRRYPEDFQVDEELGFEPSGEGAHAWLRVRKRNTNTEWAARQLARFADVRPVDIGFAGLKDRNALTTQWFSVNLLGKAEPDWTQLALDGIEILTVSRHKRKLRRGHLRGNRFTLWLRDLQGSMAGLQDRLAWVFCHGVPNYFGDQRFGHRAGNIPKAYEMLCGTCRVRDRHKRGLYVSAARALLFNQVLSRRVGSGLWDHALPGDVMMLDGTRSMFKVQTIDDDIRDRLALQDIHPTGPLWGKGEPSVSDAARVLEEEVLKPCEAWRRGLEAAGLKQERRALRLRVEGLQWSFEEEDSLRLAFRLQKGGYATMVLRELVVLSQCRSDLGRLAARRRSPSVTGMRP